jgi:hypothetical protein
MLWWISRGGWRSRGCEGTSLQVRYKLHLRSTIPLVGQSGGCPTLVGIAAALCVGAGGGGDVPGLPVGAHGA